MVRNTIRHLGSISLCSFLGLSTVFNQAFAVHSNPEDAQRLRDAIEFREFSDGFKYNVNDIRNVSVVLPVSRNFNQQMTGLCWAYGFLNALETMYLVKHPDETLELSRGAMQYNNLKDRIALKIQGVEDHADPVKYPGYLIEGGTAPDAAYLIANVGIVQFGDYHDIISPPNYTNTLKQIFAAATPNEQSEKADALLPMHFGSKVPDFTMFHGQKLASVEFGKSLLGTGTWTNYAISTTGTEYTAKDPDPDARRGAVTYYISREKIIEKMRSALANGLPVIYSDISHLVLIHGAVYDANGTPMKFYVKNSNGYPDFFYQADAERTLNRLGEITVLE